MLLCSFFMTKLSKCVCPHVCTIHSRRTMLHKVFVYGTLKKNEPNHHWLTNHNNGKAEFLSEGRTKTKYPLIIGSKYNIPFLLYSPGKGYQVKGEIYEVDDKMLSALDVLEGHPEFYQREKDVVFISKGNTGEENILDCWIYFIKKFRAELLSKEKFESYSSTGPHGLVYLERSKRTDRNYDLKADIKG